MGLADLHVHSLHSWDGFTPVTELLARAADAGLSAVAITDHDRMEGIFEAMLVPLPEGLQVIPGCEISTLDGHLIALWILAPVPSGLPLLETLERIGAQGGLAIAPHVEAKWMPSLKADTLKEILRSPLARKTLVGIETINAGLLETGSGKIALPLALSLGLASVGSSDSHLAESIGSGATWFPGNTAEDLRSALRLRETRAVDRFSVAPVQIAGKWMMRRLRKKIRPGAGILPAYRVMHMQPGR